MFKGNKPLGLSCVNEKFNLDRALVLAKASKLAYDNFEDVKKVTKKKLGFPAANVFYTSYDSSQAYVFYNDDEVLISFRGTEPTQIDDWLKDLNVIAETETNLVEAHKGFWGGYKTVAGDLIARVLPLLKKNTKLFITGHSLGGALAVACAIEIYALGILPSGVYTFGQPRVVKKKSFNNIPEELTDRIFRFANDKDIVPRVPPRKMQYWHIGQSQFFNSNGELKDDKIDWHKYKKRCKQNSKSIIGRMFELIKEHAELITDHSMDEYIKLIENCK